MMDVGPPVTALRDLQTPNRAFLEVNSRPIGQQIVIDPLRLAVIRELGYGFHHRNCRWSQNKSYSDCDSDYCQRCNRTDPATDALA